MTQTSYSNHEDLLRNRIMDAAIVCIGKKGIDKTRIGDIAKELGIARQTIYNYFSSKNELLDLTFSREAVALAENTAAHIDNYADLTDKFVQAFLYAYVEFPRNPVLGHIVESGSSFMREVGISRHAMQAFGEIVLQKVFSEQPFLNAQAAEVAELLSRTIMSFILMPDKNPRSEAELEGFIRRRVIPGLNLPDQH